MRTTVNLDDEVAAEVERLRREEGLGLSQAVNTLALAGARARRQRSSTRPFRTRTAAVGIRVNVDNVADVLDLLDDGGTG
jgi:hypothetical protein